MAGNLADGPRCGKQPSFQSQALTVFSGNTFSVKVPGRDPTSQGTFVIDPASEPRSITLIFALGLGKTRQGIRALQGDRLIIVTAEQYCPFRTEFKGAPGLPLKMIVGN